MKALIFTITLILSTTMYSQTDIESTDIFIRVFNLDGKKIGKGHIISISDKSIYLDRNNKSIEVPISEVGFIKTKHSFGNNVLIGAASGGMGLAFIGAASGGTDGGFISFSSSDLAIGGAVVGSVLGAGIGGITAIFKKSKKFEINGDLERMKVFKETVIALKAQD